MPHNPAQYTKPTPGPWYIDSIDGGVYSRYGLITQEIISYDVRNPAYLNPKQLSAHDDGGNANARLIALAPCMFELLTDIASHLAQGGPLYSGSLIFAEDAPALEVIEKLLKKAEGK